MNDGEREQLKDQLRALIAGRGDGIDIATEYRWVLSGVTSPESFFKNLHLILDPSAILYFEGCTIAPDVAKFYESQTARNPVVVVRDTIFPVPDTFHVCFTPDVIARLCEFLGNHPLNDLLDHVKAYKGEILLIAFHDAFTDDCLISGVISESVVVDFATSIGASHRRELNINGRDKEQLRHFLDAMESPKKFHTSGEPWWRRFWRRWGW